LGCARFGARALSVWAPDRAVAHVRRGGVLTPGEPGTGAPLRCGLVRQTARANAAGARGGPITACLPSRGAPGRLFCPELHADGGTSPAPARGPSCLGRSRDPSAQERGHRDVGLAPVFYHCDIRACALGTSGGLPCPANADALPFAESRCSPPFGCGVRSTSTTSSSPLPSTAPGPRGTPTSTTARGKQCEHRHRRARRAWLVRLTLGMELVCLF
jgi:hypothetical protein